MTSYEPRPRRPTALSELLRVAREESGLSQRSLAALLGVSPSKIKQVEEGTIADPGIRATLEQAEVLGVDLAALRDAALEGRTPAKLIREVLSLSAGEQFRRTRAAAHYTIDEMAAGLGIKPERLEEIERDERKPTPALWARLAAVAAAALQRLE